MSSSRILVPTHGGPEVLTLQSGDLPEPGPGQVRVRAEAAGVSFGDLLYRAGAVPGGLKAPFTPGFDVVGVVDALGEDAATPPVGTRVAALLPAGGGYAEHVVLPPDRLVAVPDGVSSVDAAAAATNYFVAHQMLTRVAQARAGQRVLVHGAAGGVGTALLQLALRAGVTAYGTVSAGKQDTVVQLGGIPLDYQREDVVARVSSLAPDGLHAVFDPIGAASFLRSARMLRRDGHLVVYGISQAVRGGRRHRSSAVAGFLTLQALRWAPTGRSATFYTAGCLDQQPPGSYQEDLAAVLTGLASGDLRPLVAECLPLSEAARAHDLLARSAVTGKLVLTCSDEGSAS